MKTPRWPTRCGELIHARQLMRRRAERCYDDQQGERIAEAASSAAGRGNLSRRRSDQVVVQRRIPPEKIG
jgi:hypothetical protein